VALVRLGKLPEDDWSLELECDQQRRLDYGGPRASKDWVRTPHQHAFVQHNTLLSAIQTLKSVIDGYHKYQLSNV